MTTLKQKYLSSIKERKATLKGVICSERDKAIADKLCKEDKTNEQKTTNNYSNEYKKHEIIYEEKSHYAVANFS